MIIEVELWQLISLLLGFFGAVGAFGKILLSQNQKHWDEKFASIEKGLLREAGQWSRVERDLLELKAELPRMYVMREDYLRGQSIIEAKIDGLALRYENAQLRGN